MRIVLFINTPAQAHTWKHVIREMLGKGYELKLLVRDYGEVKDLLGFFGFEYEIYVKPNKSKYLRPLDVFPSTWRAYRLARRFRPEILVGVGVVECFTAAMLRKPCILFNDTEHTPIQHLLCKPFAAAICTPACFRKDLGSKHVRYNGYKELAYLHPTCFHPDPSIYEELGIGRDEPYVVLRFNVWDAVHDIGRHGFSPEDKHRLVEELVKYARVFISAECKLSPELQTYALPIEPHRIHHAIHYAQLVVCDTGTMATEAAVLGTPAIRCCSLVGPDDLGNFVELEREYDLMYSFHNSDQAIQKASDLLGRPRLKDEWARKRERLLQHKIEVGPFMLDFIERYPQSYREYKDSAKSQV
jgi:predicted glycosyltransferase